MLRSASKEAEILGNPKRMAPELFKGVAFQIWHSLLAWIQLREDEVLFLEGAEDFDISGSEISSINQTRATKRPLSLASKEIGDTLNAFWDVRTKNPDKSIWYHYITTSNAAFESGNPFGDTRCGISVWNQCFRGSSDVSAIREFLLGRNFLEGSLKEFVMQSEGDMLYEHLISRIRWQVGQPDLPSLEETVRHQLIYHGDKKGISSDFSSQAANDLFVHVATVAFNKDDRSLVRADFLEQFDRATRITIPAESLAGLIPKFSLGGNAESALLRVGLVERSAPPRRGQFQPRRELQAEIFERLRVLPFVTIHGATGNGKTHLAASVAELFQNILWASFSSLDSDQSRFLLREILFGLSAGEVQLVVLDDMNFDASGVSSTKQELSHLVNIAESKRCRIIFTSQKKMPGLLLSNLGNQSSGNIQVTEFDDEELVELVRMYGCPKDDEAIWAKLIFLHTKGHPQMCHARVLNLQRRGWPKYSLEQALEPDEDILEVRSQARSLLSSASGAQSELIYRLSLVPGRFRRDHAMAFADLPPKISDPGDVFEKLAGPWIERVSQNYFRISPLLENSATLAWTADKCMEMRQFLAKTIIRVGTLSGVEINHALLLAYISRSHALLGAICQNLSAAPDNVKENIFTHISWFGELHVVSASRLVDGEPALNWALRTLQLQIAAHNKSDNVTLLSEVILRETTATEFFDNWRLARWMSLLQVASCPQVKFSASQIIALLEEIELLRQSILAGDTNDKQLFQSGEFAAFEQNLHIGAFLFIHMNERCGDRRFFSELLVLLETCSTRVRASFKQFWMTNPFLARSVIDKIWLTEEKKDSPNWDDLLATIDAIIDFGTRHQISLMAEGGLRLKIVIYDEYLKVPGKVREVIEAVCSSELSPLMADSIATFLLHQDEFAAAAEIWSKSFESPERWVQDGSEQYYALARRKAAMAFASLNRFVEAARNLIAGSDIVWIGDRSLLPLSMWADAGLCMWKAGKFSAALTILDKVLSELQTRKNSPDLDLPAFKLRKSVGQVLVHIYSQVEGEAPNKRNYCPNVGFCSDLDNAEKLRDRPIGDDRILWAFLVGMEALLELNRGIFEREISRLDQCSVPTAAILTNPMAVAAYIGRRDYKSAVFRIFKVARDSARAGAFFRNSKNTMAEIPAAFNVPVSYEEQQDVKHMLLCFIVCLILRREMSEQVTAEILNQSSSCASGASVSALISTYKGCSALDTHDQFGRIVQGDSSYEEISLCAALLINHRNLSIEELFRVHVTLFQYFKSNHLRAIIGRELSKILTAQWLERINAEFQFRTPSLTIPAIRDACKRPINTMRKVAAILLAASGGVSLRVDQRIIEELTVASEISTDAIADQ